MPVTKNNVVRGFMDMIDWEEETGTVGRGVRVYPTKKDLEHYQPCVVQCGIVQVEIREIRTVRKQCFDFSSARFTKGKKEPSKLRRRVIDRKDGMEMFHTAQQLAHFSEEDRKLIVKLAKEMEK